MKSVRDIAHELGIEKYTVANYIKRNNILPQKKIGNMYLYSNHVTTSLKRYLTTKKKYTSSAQIQLQELKDDNRKLIEQNHILLKQNREMLEIITSHIKKEKSENNL
ncbi:hypothetical protein [Ligilactobacillus agilis]|uniref:hypothetical protein n=1 Tax=Ligilactobacillus agilis TaxID=1601 RepID=UPI003D804B4D